MTIRSQICLIALGLVWLMAAPAAADTPAQKGPRAKAGKAGTPGKTAPGKAKAKARAKPPARVAQKPTARPARDPYKKLKVVVPRDKLPPIKSVRVRTKHEAEDRSRTGTVKVTVSSKPQKASVYHGGRLLGTTPFALTAKRGSTPLDVVIKRGGFMVLRTRIRRKVDRQYIFRLTPAKIR